MTGGEGPRRPGRPKGSTNKRSKELAGYVAARFGGSAAQQMASVCMVTPAEVRQAGGVLQARIQKARDLALALNIDVAAAWELLAKELAALAPYTDKRQPQAIEATGPGWAPSVVVQVEQAASLAVAASDPLDADFVEVFAPVSGQVARSKSHAEPQPLGLFDESAPRASD